MTRKISRTKPVVAVLALAAVLALSACENKVGQCEGGVDDISTLSNVAPQNPC
ncbi:MAG: hypothetical protein AB7U46_15315 [Paenirhodobacter sp.]|uniref:hypothetical protein n=1 Tax=Paenirhodobacter sp. TaxID=1965326 RepID=UPI003D0B6E12